MGSSLVPAELPGGEVRADWCPTAPVGAKSLIEPLIDSAMILTGSRILVIDDDVPLGKFLIRELKRRHFSVEVRHDGQAGCDLLRESIFDLVILDLNMPKMDGMAVIGQVRLSQPKLPILVLTARNRTEDLVSVLEKGADDCLIKPFSFLELLARVRCLLRRNSTPAASSSKCDSLTINREEHWVMRGARRIDLTMREFTLLEYLMNNVGKAISRKTLMEEVWNIPCDSATNIVDVYMKYLRDKVDLPGEVKLIRTVRGVGYVLNND
jgi:DNA-binding response OmpR family regulator